MTCPRGARAERTAGHRLCCAGRSFPDSERVVGPLLSCFEERGLLGALSHLLSHRALGWPYAAPQPRGVCRWAVPWGANRSGQRPVGGPTGDPGQRPGALPGLCAPPTQSGSLRAGLASAPRAWVGGRGQVSRAGGAGKAPGSQVPRVRLCAWFPRLPRLLGANARRANRLRVLATALGRGRSPWA